jgi:hypothetical protein
LQIDLTRRDGSQYDKLTRPFAVEIVPTVKAQGSAGVHGWSLHGEVKSLVLMNRAELDFGDEPVHGGPAATQSVRAKAVMAGSRIVASIDPAIARVQTVRRSDDENTYDISVSPLPTLQDGRFRTELQIQAISADGELHTTVVLPVRGEMRSEIYVIPPRVLVGSQPIGKKIDVMVRLEGSTKEPLTVQKTEIESSDVSVKPITKDGRTFCLTQFVREVGDHRSSVRFYVRTGDGKTLVAPLEISYRGQ